MSSRSISLLGLGILSGAMIGTALGQFLGYILPEQSTVKQFFLTTFDFSFGINATSYRYGENGEIGLFINSVDYDNSADNKALYKGDIIIGIEGYQIQSYDQLQLVLANNDARPGDTIKLRIQRENEIKVVNLVLGKSWVVEV